MAKHYIRLKTKNGDNLYPSTIVEKIENSNGSAIKYADGTMICYGRQTKSYSINDWWGFCDRTLDITITFPSVFINEPTVEVIPRAGGIMMCQNRATNGTSHIFWGFQPKNQGGTSSMFDYIAIGKWKLGGGGN